LQEHNARHVAATIGGNGVGEPIGNDARFQQAWQVSGRDRLGWRWSGRLLIAATPDGQVVHGYLFWGEGRCYGLLDVYGKYHTMTWEHGAETKLLVLHVLNTRKPQLGVFPSGVIVAAKNQSNQWLVCGEMMSLGELQWEGAFLAEEPNLPMPPLAGTWESTAPQRTNSR